MAVTMDEKKMDNLFSGELSEKVSEETSSVFALWTGLIGRLRNVQKTFETNGKRFSIQVDSKGEVTIKPIKRKTKSRKSGNE